jgi:hypothetical protein
MSRKPDDDEVMELNQIDALQFSIIAPVWVSAITQSAPPENHLLGFKVHHLRM